MAYRRKYRLALLVVLLAFFPLLVVSFPGVLHAKESSCISCHTSAGKLIKITREIAASRPKVEKSAETAGEG